MAKLAIAFATVADLALAALLIGVSGFFFGSGPESMHAGFGGMVLFAAAVIACVAAPVAGFILNGRGHAGPGILVAWLPVLGGLAVLAAPATY